VVHELLAPTLAKQGKLIVTTTDPNGPPTIRPTFYGEQLKLFLEKSPEAYCKVATVTIDSKAPKLGLEGSVDLVLVIRGMHGMHNNKLSIRGSRSFTARSNPGVLGVVQHRAKPRRTGQGSKRGYLPEKG
jgi:hypothetical protein